MKSLRVLGLCAAVGMMSLSAMGVASGSDGKIDLSPKWAVGQKTPYVLDIESKNEAVVGDKTMQLQIVKQQLRLMRRVAYIGEAGTTIELVYDGVKVSFQMQDQKDEFDSDKPKDKDDPNSPLAPACRSVVGKVVMVRLDKNGKVAEITGNKDFANGEAQQVVESLCGDELIKSVLEPLYRLNRDSAEPMAVGDSWKTHQDVQAQPFGLLKVDTQNTLKSMKGNDAEIASEAKVELLPAIGPSAVKADLTKTECKGGIVWDTGGSGLKSLQVDQSVTLVAEQNGQKVTMTNRVNTKIARGEKGAEPAPAIPGDKPAAKDDKAPAPPKAPEPKPAGK